MAAFPESGVLTCTSDDGCTIIGNAYFNHPNTVETVTIYDKRGTVRVLEGWWRKGTYRLAVRDH
jgi:hypothetical protein